MKLDSILVPQRKSKAKAEIKDAKSTITRDDKSSALSFAEMLFESHLAGSGDAPRFEISRQFLIRLLRPMFDMVRFEPKWYQSAYPDIAAACQAGALTDLKAHYCEFGFFEHRLPCFVRVDDTFYLGEYPDIGVAVSEGRVASAQWHFETFGFREGRVPSRGWRFSDLLVDD
ncbi:MAG: hypothetical protein M0002_21030 [Rhodospirillales bacterium]|nr:hypothetical protein [Rhodospirillales bacterium]